MERIPDTSHLTDEVITQAFDGTNFGRTDFRTILAETVLKRASGYHAGWTATRICEGLGLLHARDHKATRLGLAFAFHLYYTQPVRDALDHKATRLLLGVTGKRIAALEQQRDELLAAVEKAFVELERLDASGDAGGWIYDEVELLRAAISKAKGGAV